MVYFYHFYHFLPTFTIQINHSWIAKYTTNPWIRRGFWGPRPMVQVNVSKQVKAPLAQHLCQARETREKGLFLFFVFFSKFKVHG